MAKTLQKRMTVTCCSTHDSMREREQRKRFWDHYTRSRLGGHILMPYLPTLTKLRPLELTLAWRLQEAGRWQLLPAFTGLTRLVLSHDIDLCMAWQHSLP